MREFTQYIRSRGNHRKQLDRLGHADMMNIPVLSGRKHVRDDILSGQRFEGQRSDKLGGGPRQNDLHGESSLLQSSHDFDGFVGSNTTGDAQRDFHNRLPRFGSTAPPAALFRMR